MNRLPVLASAILTHLAGVRAGGIGFAVAVTLAFATQALLLLYAAHRWSMLWRWRSARRRPLSPASAPTRWPAVTVQLPVYNERLVVERLIAAVGALDYPRERLEIQVLDDSTDETGPRAAAAVARLREQGLAARHLRRSSRTGYKAGALAWGLESARGELVAVFDADFVPPSDFLRRIVPRFEDPGVGMVQARWGHLNRDRSPLTAAQAAILDSHFLLEHTVRMDGGRFFNFNGTAGVWRRACIEDAGGWARDTLTEDLDLSYRAQLRGWRFLFDSSVEAPAELPGTMESLKSQQRRWVKGSIQTARKLLPRLLASPLPAATKLEAAFHLTCNLAYPLCLLLALLLPVTMSVVLILPALPGLWLEAGSILLGVLPAGVFLAAGCLAAGARPRRAARDVGAALLLSTGLSLNNARAVLEGLGGRLGDWERTPKSGDGAARPALPPYRTRRTAAGLGELMLAVVFAAVVVLAVGGRHYGALPFALLMSLGFGWVGLGSRSSRAL